MVDKYEIDQGDGLRREIVGNWVEDKYKLLNSYVDASRTTRARFKGTPCYVDLYCGPGRVRLRDQPHTVIDGGGIGALEKSFRPSKGAAASFAKAFFADADRANVEACTERAKRFGIPVEGFVGPAEETVLEIAKKLPSNGLHLAFLDPYALGPLPFSIIKSLSKIRGIDLVIHFASLDLLRNVANPDSQKYLEATAPGWGAENKHFDLRELRRRFVLKWSSHVQSCGYLLTPKPVAIRNTKAKELYLLTVACKNQLGLDLWASFRPSPQQTMFG